MAVKGICPVCEEAGRDFLHEITPTGVRRNKEKGSDTWQQLVLHSDGQGGLCPGGGKSI